MLKEFTGDFLPTGRVIGDATQLLLLHGCRKTAEHSARVAAQAKALAKKFAVHPGKAEKAGYLHDISAIIPVDRRIDFALSHGVTVLPEEAHYPMISHQKLSVVLASGIFQVTDEEILSAIGCHTTLKANASQLDKVVFLADKIAWDQKGKPPYSKAVLAALDESLDAAVLEYLNFLWERRDQLQVIHPWFVEAREQMLQRATSAYEP